MSESQTVPGTSFFKIPFDVAVVDSGNNYDLTNYVFRCPVSGKYLLLGMVSAPANFTETRMSLYESGGINRITINPTQAIFGKQSLGSGAVVSYCIEGSVKYATAKYQLETGYGTSFSAVLLNRDPPTMSNVSFILFATMNL
jgi:hypothetical protein